MVGRFGTKVKVAGINQAELKKDYVLISAGDDNGTIDFEFEIPMKRAGEFWVGQELDVLISWRSKGE